MSNLATTEFFSRQRASLIRAGTVVVESMMDEISCMIDGTMQVGSTMARTLFARHAHKLSLEVSMAVTDDAYPVDDLKTLLEDLGKHSRFIVDGWLVEGAER